MHLILVPGLDDAVAGYRATAMFWRARGFTPHVHSFGWRDGDRADFNERMCRFFVTLNSLNSLGAPVYAVGVSAGGTVVLNALLARPELFERVALVASPVARTSYEGNALLNSSLMHLHQALGKPRLNELARAHVFAGETDARVSLQDAVLPGVATTNLGRGSHATVIARALTVRSGDIARWLANGSTGKHHKVRAS